MEILALIILIVLLIIIRKHRKKKELYNYFWDNKQQCWCKYRKEKPKKQRQPKQNAANSKYYRETGYRYNEETQLWEPKKKRRTPRM